MRKLLVMCILAGLLTGCAAKETMETVTDVYVPGELPQAAEMEVWLPETAAAPAMELGEGQLYLCDGYTVILQTFAAGDLKGTVEAVSGLPGLTLMETKRDGISRYEGVWSCAGEGGDLIGRLCILDDGSYHYALTVLGPAAQADSLTKQWQQISASFSLTNTGQSQTGTASYTRP